MTSTHRYSYYIKPKHRIPALPDLNAINGTVSLEERMQTNEDLEEAIIQAVIVLKDLDCDTDDLQMISFEFLPEKDDE